MPACENCGREVLRRWRCEVCCGLVCNDCFNRSSGDDFGWCARYPSGDYAQKTPDYCKQRWALVGKPKAWSKLTPKQQKTARKIITKELTV